MKKNMNKGEKIMNEKNKKNVKIGDKIRIK